MTAWRMPKISESEIGRHSDAGGYSIGHRLIEAPKLAHDQALLQAIEESNQLPIPNDFLVSVTIPDEHTTGLSYQVWANALVDQLRLISGHLDSDRSIKELHLFLDHERPAVTLVEHVINRIQAHFAIADDAILNIHMPITTNIEHVLTRSMPFFHVHARLYMDSALHSSQLKMLAGSQSTVLDSVGIVFMSPETPTSPIPLKEYLEALPEKQVSFISFENLNPNKGPYINLLNNHPDANLCIEHLRRHQFHLIGAATFVQAHHPLGQAFEAEHLGLGVAGHITEQSLDHIGLGPHAISMIGDYLSITQSDASAYIRRAQEQRLPIRHGLAMSQDDLIRQTILSDLACTFELSIEAIQLRFKICFKRYFEDAYPALKEACTQGLVEWTGERVKITDAGLTHLNALLSLFSLPIGSVSDEPQPLSRIG